MSRERELLERAYYVLGELSYAMLKDSGEYNLAGDIYEFLSTPEPKQDEPVDISYKFEPTVAAVLPNGVRVTNVHDAYIAGMFEGSGLAKLKVEQDEEPVAWTCQDELNALGTDVTCYMYAEPLVGETNIPLYLHPAPRPDFVRLSEEEIMDLCRGKCVEFRWPSTAIETARAIEDALEEANRYKPFVRLSEEEVNNLLGMSAIGSDGNYELICAVENRLVEKNRG